MRRRRRLTVIAAVVMVMASACGGGSSASDEALDALLAGAPATYEYVIPDGTAELAATSTTHATIFPDLLTARIGESIRIINDDTSGHTIGPFAVGPGQTLTQLFTARGVFSGICSTHQGATFTLTVNG